MALVHWVQLAGTTAVATVGSCPLARTLALMPWNRTEPLTLERLRGTSLSRSQSGGILRPVRPVGGEAAHPATSCADAGACGIPVGERTYKNMARND